MRTTNQQRRSIETAEETESRLRQVRESQQQRLAAETPEERDARLFNLRLSQQQPLAAESCEETELRRQRDRNNHRRPCSLQQPLLHQPTVQSKINKFHTSMASLQMSACVVCMERFPGMTVMMTSAGTECARCSSDKHSPKAYSLENNMHPGPVPQELLVGCYT